MEENATVLSTEFYNSLVQFIETINICERETEGGKWGIVYSEAAVLEVFNENDTFKDAFGLSYDGFLIIPEDEEIVYGFLDAVNKKAVSEMFEYLVLNNLINVKVDINGKIVYNILPDDEYKLNLRIQEDNGMKKIMDNLIKKWHKHVK